MMNLSFFDPARGWSRTGQVQNHGRRKLGLCDAGADEGRIARMAVLFVRSRSHNWSRWYLGSGTPCKASTSLCNEPGGPPGGPVHRSHGSSDGMLDVFGQEVVHIIADAVAKGVTDLAHTVKSGDQAVAAAGG